jgi:O-antigen/teichoic acid export membrane protein
VRSLPQPSSPYAFFDFPVTTNSLLGRTFVLLTGHLSVVALQGLQFIFLARLLGVQEFGRVAAITALITIAAPLSGLGYGNVMLMQVSRNPALAPTYYANAVSTALGMGAVLVVFLWLLNPLIYGNDASAWLVVWMAASELMAVRVCGVSAQLYQAIDRVRYTSLINSAVSLCRLAGIAPLLFMAHPTAAVWALSAASLTACLACTVVYFSIQQAGGFRINLSQAWREKKESTHFTLGTTAKAAYTDVDKVMLGIFHSPAVLGAYSSAYRLVVMAFMPVRALLDGVASRFFKVGEQGSRGTFELALRLLRYALPYSAAVGVALYFLAPLLPWVLGKSYADAVPALQALCVLPAIQAVHYVFSDALTGAGLQKLRTQLQFIALAAYGVLGLLLIPQHGWLGAVWTCIAAESLLALMVLLAAKLKADDQT